MNPGRCNAVVVISEWGGRLPGETDDFSVAKTNFDNREEVRIYLKEIVHG